MSSPAWDNARRHARALETALNGKLATYSQIATQIASTGLRSEQEPGPADEDGVGGYRLVEEEIEELLAKFEQAIDDMSALINSPSQPPSASMQTAAQRHREMFDDHRHDYLRVRGNIENALARSNLLGSVRKDISDYKTARSSQTDALLADRSRIDSSNRMMDETLDQAYATRTDFREQRTLLGQIDQRMGGVVSQMPGINSLISMISSRRRRDTYIVGGVTAVCVLLLLAYTFGW